MDNEVVFLFVVFVILAVAVGVIVGDLYFQEGVGEPPADHGEDSGHDEPALGINSSGNSSDEVNDINSSGVEETPSGH